MYVPTAYNMLFAMHLEVLGECIGALVGTAQLGWKVRFRTAMSVTWCVEMNVRLLRSGWC